MSGEPLRILIVENDAADAELMIDALERGGVACGAEVVSKRHELWDALRVRRDLVLTDYNLTDWTALEQAWIAAMQKF